MQYTNRIQSAVLIGAMFSLLCVCGAAFAASSSDDTSVSQLAPRAMAHPGVHPVAGLGVHPGLRPGSASTAQSFGGAADGASAAPAPQTIKVPERDASPSGSDAFAFEQAQLPLLEVQAKEAQLRAQIAQANWQTMHPQTGGVGGAAAGGAPGALPPVVAPVYQTSAPPVMVNRSCVPKEGMCAVAVNGFGSSGYRAVISFGGTTREVGVGDSVNGGWVVGSITDANVHLTRGRVSVDLESPRG